jgi:hypothetical protein
MWKSVLVMMAVAGMSTGSTSLGADSVPPTQAADHQMSIQYLYEACTGADSALEMYCIGYISATEDAMTTIGIGDEAKAFGMCSKATVSYGAAIQAFKNWAQKHPETWSAPRYMGVALALKETWPCK